MNRNSITVTLNGPAQLYYANMFDDVKASVRKSAREADGIIPVITDAHIIRHIIADYFLMKYGQDERKKIRNIFFSKDIEEIEQNQKIMDARYASG